MGLWGDLEAKVASYQTKITIALVVVVMILLLSRIFGENMEPSPVVVKVAPLGTSRTVDPHGQNLRFNATTELGDSGCSCNAKSLEQRAVEAANQKWDDGALYDYEKAVLAERAVDETGDLFSQAGNRGAALHGESALVGHLHGVASV